MPRRVPSTIVLIASTSLAASCASTQPADSRPEEVVRYGGVNLVNETPAQFDARMEWFREAKFGMFVHWGLYSVAAGEWQGRPVRGIGEWILSNARIRPEDYAVLQQRFNPVKFDAKRWVAIAKDAGTVSAMTLEQWRASLARIPLGRVGKPEEVAAAIGFLCSPAAAYVTGQALHVNGGLVI